MSIKTQKKYGGFIKSPIYAAVAANIAIAIAKFIGASISGSSAMLSEGIHSFVDSGNGLLLLYGINRSKKGPDEEHSLGHGKEIYFWSLVVAILIFALGGGVSLYEGIEHIRHPEPAGNPMINYIVLGVAMVFEGRPCSLPCVALTRPVAKPKWDSGRQSPKVRIQQAFAVIFEDSAALLGLIVAFLGVFLSEYTGINF